MTALENAPAEPAVASNPKQRAALRRARTVLPGLALALAVAAVATVVGQYVPLVGSARGR